MVFIRITPGHPWSKPPTHDSVLKPIHVTPKVPFPLLQTPKVYHMGLLPMQDMRIPLLRMALPICGVRTRIRNMDPYPRPWIAMSRALALPPSPIRVMELSKPQAPCHMTPVTRIPMDPPLLGTYPHLPIAFLPNPPFSRLIAFPVIP